MRKIPTNSREPAARKPELPLDLTGPHVTPGAASQQRLYQALCHTIVGGLVKPGEPLPPSMVAWGHEALGCEICDQYGQTELGMVICNNAHPDVARPVKPGSMGLPMPGITGGIEHGQIALDTEDSPMFWFSGYLDSPDKTATRFSEDRRWYLTGDTGRWSHEDVQILSNLIVKSMV